MLGALVKALRPKSIKHLCLGGSHSAALSDQGDVYSWGDGRSGSANQFFDTDRYALVRSAAEREGLPPDGVEDLVVSMAGLRAGGCSVHNGRTWHGSGANESAAAPPRL